MHLFTFLVLGLTATGAVAQEWPTGTGGNPSRNGLTDVAGPTGADLLWSGSRPAIVAQQAVADANLVVMSRIGSFTIPTGTWIVAQDLYTGNEVWATQLPYDFPGTSWRSRVSAMRDGRVYATRAGNTNFDYMYALSSADGSIVWQSEDLVNEHSTESASFASDGDLIVGNFNSVMRIEHTDGSTVWTTSRSCPTSNGCEAAVFGDRVYLFQADVAGPKITAFDIDSGANLYSSPGIGGGFVNQVGPFVGPDGTVYAPRTANTPNDFLVAFNDTGTALVEKWRVPLGYVPFASFGVGPDGSVYSYTRGVEGNALTVLRLDPDTGATINTSTTPIPIDSAHPRMAIDRDGLIFMINGSFANGALHAFNPDLTARWSTSVANVNIGGPVLAGDGVMIVCGIGNDVRAYHTPCEADWNGDGLLNTADVLAYLNDYNAVLGGGSPTFADPDLAFPDGVINTADLLAYLNLYAAGC